MLVRWLSAIVLVFGTLPGASAQEGTTEAPAGEPRGVLDAPCQLVVVRGFHPVRWFIRAVACARARDVTIRGPVTRLTRGLPRQHTGLSPT